MKRLAAMAFVIAVLAVSATAQTTVTTSGTTSSGTVPVFNGTATVTNSPINVSGSNVGIGTTAPQATLDVRGTISGGNVTSTSGSVILQGYYTAGALSVWGSQESTGAPIMGYGVIPANMIGSFLSSTSVPTSRAAIVVGDTISGVGVGMINFYAGSMQTQAIGSSVTMSPTMTIMNSGNVGIGTTSPVSLLSVGPSSQFQVNSSGAVASGPITSSGPVGIGVSPQYTLDVAGQIHASQAIYASGGITFADGSSLTSANTLCGGDYAESVNVSGDRSKYGPGDVLVIDPNVSGSFLKSAEPYSTSVTGIFSTKPGAIGRRQVGPKSANEVPMAMIGIVPTKVSAENGPIHRGDLLVTSSTIGYAMKGTDRSRLTGAVIGKALDNLESGKGVIEVVVTLQ